MKLKPTRQYGNAGIINIIRQSWSSSPPSSPGIQDDATTKLSPRLDQRRCECGKRWRTLVKVIFSHPHVHYHLIIRSPWHWVISEDVAKLILNEASQVVSSTLFLSFSLLRNGLFGVVIPFWCPSKWPVTCWRLWSMSCAIGHFELLFMTNQ